MGDGGGGSAERLGMKNVGGIFVTVFIGCFAAITLGTFRWISNIRIMAKRFNVGIPFEKFKMQNNLKYYFPF